MTHSSILPLKYLLSKLLYFVRLCAIYFHWETLKLKYIFPVTLTSRSLFFSWVRTFKDGSVRMVTEALTLYSNKVWMWVYICHSCHSWTIWPWIRYSIIPNYRFLTSKTETIFVLISEAFEFIKWHYLDNVLNIVLDT